MKYGNNISSVKGFTKKFIDGSATSLKYTRVCEHEAGEPHKAAKKCKDQDHAKEIGEAYRVEVPSDAPIVQGLKRMRESEHRGIQKLFDVAYYIAKKGRSLTDFESLIALEKMWISLEQATKIGKHVVIFCCQFRIISFRKTFGTKYHVLTSLLLCSMGLLTLLLVNRK